MVLLSTLSILRGEKAKVSAVDEGGQMRIQKIMPNLIRTV